MNKYDKSLNEVWEWKEKVYHKMESLSTKEYIKKVKRDTEKVLSENKIELLQIYSQNNKEKIA